MGRQEKRDMSIGVEAVGKKSVSVLLVEDDPDLITLVSNLLDANGFRAVSVSTGEDAVSAIQKEQFDVALLDIKLPDMLGFDVLAAIRADPAVKSLPVIMISQVDDEQEIVKALNMGADDYVTKPFSAPVLIARVHAVLRRADQVKGTSDVVQYEGLSLDVERFTAVADGAPLDLGLSEFRILYTLMSNRGKVMTRDQIIEAVHGEKYPVTDRSVDVQIVGLRKKLGAYANFIETVRGIGYRFAV